METQSLLFTILIGKSGIIKQVQVGPPFIPIFRFLDTIVDAWLESIAERTPDIKDQILQQRKALCTTTDNLIAAY